MDNANMDPITAARATPRRCEATCSTEKPASLVVTFRQDVCTEEEVRGNEGEEGEEVEDGKEEEEETVRQTWYSVAGRR